MPEGHSVHRIARQFARNYVGREVAASSPQGRFAEGAALLDGRTVLQSEAIGKQMFLEFDGGLYLRVHLGLYGAWDFSGEITSASMGAPRKPRKVKPRRRGRFRMSEQTTEMADELSQWPPPIVGQVRLRLLTEVTCADLRGPTACVVMTPDEVAAFLLKLGPDPLVGDPDEGEERFVARVRKTRTAIGLLLMDPSVVSGIGNVYRAELLFRARLNPHTPGRDVREEVLRDLWRDWTKLLTVGVESGQMITRDELLTDPLPRGRARRGDRNWVYHRAGLPCRICGTEVLVEPAAGRKLYWCPYCQA